MKKIAGILLSFALITGSASPIDILTWAEEKISEPTVTAKKAIDLIALTSDLATTKDTKITEVVE